MFGSLIGNKSAHWPPFPHLPPTINISWMALHTGVPQAAVVAYPWPISRYLTITDDSDKCNTGWAPPVSIKLYHCRAIIDKLICGRVTCEQFQAAGGSNLPVIASTDGNS